MSKRIFTFCFWSILIFGFVLRVVPLRNNNFYFTMDQGANAVNAREIWYRHQFVLRGPETSILGFYNGPLWYYFVALGYGVAFGHPVGPLLLLIFLNLFVCATLMQTLARKISPILGLFTGVTLQFYWWFYDVSRYSFNPFPLVAFAVIEILLLIEYLEGKKGSFLIASIPVGLAFHTELASFPPLLALYFVAGLWGIVRNRNNWCVVVGGLCIVFLFFVPHGIDEIRYNFSQTRSVWNHLTSIDAVFPKMNWKYLDDTFIELVSKGVIFQSIEVSFIYISSLLLLFFFRTRNNFSRYFVIFSGLLIGISFIWFGSSSAWHRWHTVYIPPLVFVSLLIMLWYIPRKLGIVLFLVTMSMQILVFTERYREYFYPFADASLLTNELKAIDWVYQKSDGNGFYVYSYLPSVYDYPYQYLFWWYGKKKYGYVPCEYSSYPRSPDTFVPGKKYYTDPQRECTTLRFLIVEPDKNDYLRQQWLQNVREHTTFLEETHIGTITLEKRELQVHK